MANLVNVWPARGRGGMQAHDGHFGNEWLRMYLHGGVQTAFSHHPEQYLGSHKVSCKRRGVEKRQTGNWESAQVGQVLHEARSSRNPRNGGGEPLSWKKGGSV